MPASRLPTTSMALILMLFALLRFAASANAAVTDVPANGLAGKLVVGYQGWFGCPGDYGGNRLWIHWFLGNVADAAHLRVELLPDVAEYPKDTLCPTELKREDGTVIELYSAQEPGAVALHFHWMAQYGIDGAAVQRFVGGTTNPGLRSRLDHVLANERAAAEANGRIFYVLYDVSGANPNTVVADIQRDWPHLVNDLGITASPRYLRDHGKPVLEIWGFGLRDRPGGPAEVEGLLRALKTGGLDVPAVTLIGGVSPEWRTLDGSSRNNPAWTEVYRTYDVISPWFAGRPSDDAGLHRYMASRIAGDVALTRGLGIGYMPVVFPGFSWSNLMRAERGQRAPFNAIPRRCGEFMWTQIRDLLAMHVNMIYVAMFDEVDEGTAIYKLVSQPQYLPAGTQMLALDQDGCRSPNDWYLKVTGAANRYLRTGAPPPSRLGEALPK